MSISFEKIQEIADCDCFPWKIQETVDMGSFPWKIQELVNDCGLFLEIYKKKKEKMLPSSLLQ